MSAEVPVMPLPTKIARRWFDERTYTAARIPAVGELVRRKREQGVRISVGIPALNEEGTIADVCRVISGDLMKRCQLVDELVVLDGVSVDETSLRAQAAGARVVDVSTILPHVPFAGGKGESLWRSLAHLRGDIVVWVDADIRNFGPEFVTRLVAPLLLDPGVEFVKGYYRRPLELEGVRLPSGGGRVTELLARPLLDLMFPELAGVLQPLSGEYAGRADTLRRLPFFTGYSVEVGLLIDLLDVVGLDGIAQADLGTRLHRNRPLQELSSMAFGIARTILQRAEEHHRLKTAINPYDNPLVRGDGNGGLVTKLLREFERPPIELLPPVALEPADLAKAL